MIRRNVFSVIAIAVFAAGGFAGELGPKELRGRTSKVRADAARVRAAIAREGAEFVRKNTVRHRTDRTFAELLYRYVPGCEQLGAGKPINRAVLTAEEKRLLDGYAERLAVSAEALLRAGLGGAAGLEAFRAHGLNPANRRAGMLLLYDLVDGEFRPRRYRAMRSRGLALTQFGWLPEPLARAERPGMSPDQGRWLPTRTVDVAHASWDRRYVMSFNFIEIQTNAPHAQIVEWATRVDETVGWMRSLFLRVPGYQEPVWPLLIHVYKTPQEAQANGDRPPLDMAYWRGHGVVNAAAFGPRTMKMENAVQRAVANGLLEHAFPVDMNGGVYSGWMVEAFGRWAAFASADRPNDSGFTANMDRKGTLMVAEIRRGRDIFSELRKMPYADAVKSDLTIAAPLLAEFCFAEEQRWEGFARFASRVSGYREQYPDFDNFLFPAPDTSRALKSWLDAAAAPVVNPGQPGAGPATGVIRHTVTINSRFLSALGIDVAGLKDSLGDPAAVKIAQDAITAFVSARTVRGKPAAGVNATLSRLHGRHEWNLLLNGPAAGVRSLLTDILWQAGVRLPPGAVPMPGGAPTPAVDGVQPPTRPQAPTPTQPQPPIRPHLPGADVPGTPQGAPVPATPVMPVEPGPQLIPVSTATWAKQSLTGIAGVSAADLNRVGQGKPSAIMTLLALLKNGTDPARGAAAVILGRVGPVAPTIVPALTAALTDRVDENRRMVAQAFQQFGVKAASSTPTLVDRLGVDPYWVARQQLAIALQKMPEANLKREMTDLILALDDKEKRVQAEVVKVLEKLQGSHPEARIALAAYAQRDKLDVKRLLDDILGGND